MNMYKDTFIQFTDQKAEVHFERKTSEVQLEEIKSKLLARGIIITYSPLEHDGQLLSKLGFEIRLPNGQIAKAQTNFVNMRAKAFGFRIRLDVNPNSMMVGDL